MQIRYLLEMFFFLTVVLIFQWYCLNFTQTWNDLQIDLERVKRLYNHELLMN